MKLFKYGKIQNISNIQKTRFENILAKYNCTDEYEEYELNKINEELDIDKFFNRFGSLFPGYNYNYTTKNIITYIYNLYIKDTALTNYNSDKAKMIKNIVKYSK